ncbi:hypothetical protein [Schaalia sp. lx-100]|uniref:hypothetical protein n=1 Tax=Schaalia sp. lx-100 TaxID=2899081 RepID=UPI001E60742F|nr:hypothetical protein [Schaalia sp. lx-100]MCD4557447.1 hypothetical protein [Schaalia sp. lx-100]
MRRIDLNSLTFRSGVFAFIFAPLALIIMNVSMADIYTRTAVGLPLASVEGMLGMGLAALIFVLIAFNCDKSSAGLFVSAFWSIPIGIAQLTNLLYFPKFLSFSVTSTELSAAVTWNFQPIAVTAILFGSACAAYSIHHTYAAHLGIASNHQGKYRHNRQKKRIAVAIAVVPLTILATMLLIEITPLDTAPLASGHFFDITHITLYSSIEALIAAACLGAVALMSRWSLGGPQICAWVLLVIPAYFLEPLWSTLTGNVVTPGYLGLNTHGHVAPIIASLGFVLGTTTLGVHWARITHLRSFMENAKTSKGADAPAEYVDYLNAAEAL